MILTLVRLKQEFNVTAGRLFIDSIPFCWTLEDLHHDIKIHGQTRIPEGQYNLGLRSEGGFYQRYTKRFGEHHPMIQIQDVPEYEYILFHIGNTHVDTEGCTLIGQAYNGGTIIQSTDTYEEFHRLLCPRLEAGEAGIINVIDAERQINNLYLRRR